MASTSLSLSFTVHRWKAVILRIPQSLPHTLRIQRNSEGWEIWRLKSFIEPIWYQEEGLIWDRPVRCQGMRDKVGVIRKENRWIRWWDEEWKSEGE